MTVAELIVETRRLAADPEGFPSVPDIPGVDPQADDPQPRWSRADILRVAGAALESLAFAAPRAFQTGDRYAEPETAPVLGSMDNDAVPGLAPVGRALACMAASDLLADILDAGAAKQAESLAQRARALLEGFLEA